MLMTNLQSAVTIEDLRRLARKRLPDFLFGPMDAGAGQGAGSARNVRRLGERLLVPRALIDVSGRSHATTVFGREYSSAFGISAVGYAGNYRRNADLLLAESARAANVPFILSGGGTASIESVARIAPDQVWYQLYVAKDASRTSHMIGRARDCGITVMVVTVDYPVAPRVESLMRSGVRPPASVPLRSLPYVLWELIKHPAWTFEFLMQGGPAKLESWACYSPDGASAADIARDFSAQVPNNQTWNDLERIRALWPGKLVIKGLLHPDDALRAVDLGADGVTVSNHGSVKLDCMPATIDLLPAITKAVGRRIPVFFDGGIRCGPDVIVALCLGANMGFVGRASLYGVSAAGRAGADRALQILRDEISQTLAMIGCPNIAALGPEFIFIPPG
jgi:isopentenyl diphosphate isomerase/L-lactate dehydrogenase-like FMN-dependent dehydrogenase